MSVRNKFIGSEAEQHKLCTVIFPFCQTMTVDGKVYSTYDKLDSATFGSNNARGVEAFTIVSRQFVAVANHADDLGKIHNAVVQ